MKLTFLGTCSGTEPVAGYRHVAFTVEPDAPAGGVYFFDAGEGCSRTAHLMGIDLLAVRAIFITHTHMDHIGGLGNLLWNMRKLAVIAPRKPHKLAGKTVAVFIPEPGAFEGLLQMLRHTEGGFALDYTLEGRRFGDGEVFDDGDLRVVAMHNTHLGLPAPGEPWRSFSFRIAAAGRSVVYSGDTGGVDELRGLLESPCDLLLMETGHHRVADVCAALRDADADVGRVAFIHHGRAVLDDPDAEARAGAEALGRDVLITRDGMTLDL